MGLRFNFLPTFSASCNSQAILSPSTHQAQLSQLLLIHHHDLLTAPPCCYCLLCICPTSPLSANLPTLSDFPAEIPEAENLIGSAHSPLRPRFWTFNCVLDHIPCWLHQLMATGAERSSLGIENYYFTQPRARGCSSGH